MKQFLRTGLLLALVTITPASFACSVMGANTHVGNIMSVNSQARTLTIMDEETSKPITFSVNEQLLLKLSSAKGQVVVHYTGKGGKLTATDIQ